MKSETIKAMDESLANTYLALTIGPIDQTISQARKTRELWAGSYIFSVLMRELIKAFQQHKIGGLLTPKVELDKNEIRNGAGIFPDRCFYKIPEDASNLPIAKAIEDALDQTGEVIWNKKKQGGQLRPFFRIYAAEVTLENDEESAIQKLNEMLDVVELQPLMPPGDESLVDRLENNIHSLYEDSIFEAPKEEGLQNPGEEEGIETEGDLLEKKEEQEEEQSAEIKSVFIQFDDNKQKRLPSILEIATRELRDVVVSVSEKDKDNQGQKDNSTINLTYDDIITEPINQAVLLYQKLRRRQKLTPKEKLALSRVESEKQESAIRQWKSGSHKVFKFRHKYVCFVKADGDSVGKTIEAIGNDLGFVGAFSSHLAFFAQAAVNEIVKYDGLPIYAGGDDLFFLAPLQNNQGLHIFDLIKTIDQLFPSFQLKALGQKCNPNFDKTPTLSYGLSVSYYKYPMFESIEEMDELLFKKAKGFKGKNAIAFRVLKHSGQAFGSIVRKLPPLDKTAEGLDQASSKKEVQHSFSLLIRILTLCRTEESSFLTAVMHKLHALQPFLGNAIKNGQTSFFFKNHFNEAVHVDTSAAAYIESVCQLCETLWTEEQSTNTTLMNVDRVVEQVYAILRLIQFLNQEDHD